MCNHQRTPEQIAYERRSKRLTLKSLNAIKPKTKPDNQLVIPKSKGVTRGDWKEFKQ